jgi:hypothetical protein
MVLLLPGPAAVAGIFVQLANPFIAFGILLFVKRCRARMMPLKGKVLVPRSMLESKH